MTDAKIERFKVDLFKAIEADPDIDEKAKAAVRASADAVGAEIPDTKVYRWAVGGLVIISILIVLGAFWLYAFPAENSNGDIPGFFETIIAVAVGALASMLGYAKATNT